MLKRIFTSIASLNKFASKSVKASCTYYAAIQKQLFVCLLNNSFRKPVFCVNNCDKREIRNISSQTKSDENNKQKRKERRSDSSKSFNIYLINPDLLANVIIEWSLWQPFDTFSLQEGKSIRKSSTNLWKHIFETLNNLLEDDHSSYHSDIFIKFNLLDKLMHFLLDANGENCVFEKNSCVSLVCIFKHFNLMHKSNSSQAKKLFANFFEYLHILHAENNAYITYITGSFFYNLTLSLPSVPFASIQDYPKTHFDSQPKLEPEDSIQTTTPIQTQKRQILSLDRFQQNENQANFSQISAGFMQIMHDMITILPDYMLNEILNLLKYESFIMFAMVKILFNSK